MVHHSNLWQCLVTSCCSALAGHVSLGPGILNASRRTDLFDSRPDNPRYFADANNRIVTLPHRIPHLGKLSGCHRVFDYPAYLDRLTALHHNFIRLWVTESIHSDGGWLMNPPQ